MTKKENIHWGTPKYILEYLNKIYKISKFDPAPYPRPINYDGLKNHVIKFYLTFFVNLKLKNV